MLRLPTYLVCVLLFVGCSLVAAQETKPAGEGPKITYEEHVKPILREHCFSCHNQEQKKGGLALDSYSAAMTGGSSGEVVLGGDVDSSRIYALTSHKEQPKMPPMQDRLAAAKLEILQKWIEGGALENTGSKAVIKKKKSTSLMAAPSSKGKPEVVAMPEGLWRQPVLVTPRAGSITALATSPWGPLVAVAGQKQIVLYNTDSLECLGVFPYPEGIPQVLKFSRNGSVLLAGGGRGGHSGSVVLFDVKTGRRLAKLGDELDAILAADINSSHTLVALGSPLKMVRIYSVETGEKLFEVKKHTDWVYAVEFSPDGVLLATSDRSGGVFVWEAATAREYLSMRGHNGAVFDLAWRPDSNILATGGEDGTVRLWEMNDGNAVKNWAAHGGGVFQVDYTHDGRIVSAGRDRSVKTWNGEGVAFKSYALADDALRCSFTHDGKRVIGGDWSGNVKLWDTESAAEVGTLLANPPTLAVRLEQAKAEVARLQPLAQAATNEYTAAEKVVQERTVLVNGLNEKIAALEAATIKAETERVAAAKGVQDSTNAAKVAQEALAVAQAETAKQAAVKTQADTLLAEKTAAAKQTLEVAAQEKTTADKLTAENSAEAPAAQAKAQQAQVTAAASEQERATVAKTVEEATAKFVQMQATEQVAVKATETTKVVVDAANKLLGETTTLAQAAANAVPPVKAERETRAKELAEAVAQLPPRKAALDAAGQQLAVAQQRATSVETELASFTQAGGKLLAAVEQAKQKADAFNAPLSQTEAERLTAEKIMAEKAAAAKVVADKLAALLNEQKVAQDAQKQAELMVVEKVQRLNEIKSAQEIAQEELEQAEAVRQAFEAAYGQKN